MDYHLGGPLAAPWLEPANDVSWASGVAGARADFDAEWVRCTPWLVAALARDGFRTHVLADVKAAVEQREARFWAGRRAAMVTEIQAYPQRKTLFFWLAGGDLAELCDELRPLAEAWGKAHGCSLSVIVGRKGWSRALADYQPAAYTCAKEL